MNILLDSDSRSFGESFELAKRVLEYMVRFRTPPTPAAYEVWYRFVEDSIPEIQDRLSYAVNDANSVTSELLNELHRQYCNSAGSEVREEIFGRLGVEIRNLLLAIHHQKSNNQTFGEAVGRQGNILTSADATPDVLRNCAANLLKCSGTIQSQLDSTKKHLETSEAQVSRLKSELIESQKRAMTDPLTGVGNRRYFEAMVASALKRYDSDGDKVVSMILFDLDEFKAVNDCLGHAVGDRLLKYFATSIQGLREDLCVARYGGDEFAVLLKSKSSSESLTLAEEIRNFVATNRYKYDQSQDVLEKVTVSIGVAILRNDDTRESWFDRADKLLYHAKQDGRNCVRAERRR